MKTKYAFVVLIGISLSLIVLAFVPCKMKYKEHYRITSVQLEVLKVNGQNKYHEAILDPVSTIVTHDSVMLYLRFENEFFSTGVKTKNFPKWGSLGPVDTIQSLHFLIRTSDSKEIVIDSSLSSSVIGRRVELSAPHALPGHNICVSSPMVSYSSIPDFISKFNARKEEVLFEELKDNGLILGLDPSVIPGNSPGQKVDFVVTLQLTSGKIFSDTASATFIAR